MGAVTVGGDWITGNLVAGAVAGVSWFGTSDDARLSGVGVRNLPGVLSRLGPVQIGRQVLGDASSPTHYGFVAGVVRSFGLGGTLIPLDTGAHKDHVVRLEATGFVTVNET